MIYITKLLLGLLHHHQAMISVHHVDRIVVELEDDVHACIMFVSSSCWVWPSWDPSSWSMTHFTKLCVSLVWIVVYLFNFNPILLHCIVPASPCQVMMMLSSEKLLLVTIVKSCSYFHVISWFAWIMASLLWSLLYIIIHVYLLGIYSLCTCSHYYNSHLVRKGSC